MEKQRKQQVEEKLQVNDRRDKKRPQETALLTEVNPHKALTKQYQLTEENSARTWSPVDLGRASQLLRSQNNAL
eukprot:12906672-Prorocentrum_lima.AAC.1